MTNIIVCHSRKGGVGKTTLAYELAWLLDAVLVDLEHDGGGATSKWGDRPLDRIRIPILDSVRTGSTPKPLRGFRKPRLIPGHPALLDQAPDETAMADALVKWAQEWDTDWVVVDTHPGASPHTHGAMAVANIVLAPTPLRVADLAATEQMVNDMADYPLVISPTMVPSVPSASIIKRLERIVDGTPVQVSSPIPEARGVGLRTKRMAITAEDPPPKALAKVAAALEETAEFMKEYVR